MFSVLIKHLENESWDEEQMIINQKLTEAAKTSLRSENVWERFNRNILKVIPIFENSNGKDFQQRLNGDFLKDLVDKHKHSPNVFRSLILIMRTLSEYK